MRDIMNVDPELGGVFIEDIKVNLESRDELPKILLSLKALYCNPVCRERLFKLLQDKVLPGVDLNNGRPAMGLWQALVLAIVKQGAAMDYDKLRTRRTTTRGCVRCWDTASGLNRSIRCSSW